MKSKTMIFLLATAIPCAAFGQGATSYQCTNGDLTRRVEILTDPGVSVPCEVHYYKDTEAPGERQVLWSATAEVGYCERKTEEFVAKLQGWGWDCGPSAATPAVETDDSADAAAATDAADDTDALMPAEEPETAEEE